VTITISELLAKFGGPLVTVSLWAVIAIFVLLVIIACVRGKAVGIAGQVVAGFAAIAAVLALVWRRVRDRT
jgi:nitrate reductase gamma subunit